MPRRSLTISQSRFGEVGLSKHDFSNARCDRRIRANNLSVRRSLTIRIVLDRSRSKRQHLTAIQLEMSEYIEGRWWLEPSSSPVFGVLRLSPNGLPELTTKDPQVTSNFVSLLKMAANDACQDRAHIQGRDAHDRPISLFDCCSNGHSLSGGMTERRFIASVATRGVELGSLDEKRFLALRISVPHLHEWLGFPIVTGFQLSETEYAWKRNLEQAEIVHEIEDGIRFRIDVQCSLKGGRDSFEIHPSHAFWFHFESLISIKECLDKWVPWTSDLFSLLIGEMIRCEQIELFESDPWIPGKNPSTCEILSLPRQQEQKISPWRITDFQTFSASFQEILTSWNNVRERFMPAINLFCSATFWTKLPLETSFIFLVQAVEVFHARAGRFGSAQCSRAEHLNRVSKILLKIDAESQDWVRQTLLAANNKRLDDRLFDLFQVHSDHAKKLFPSSHEMADRIRYTRNYLTHYNGNPESKKFIQPKEMMIVNKRLKALLWILLLGEIGCNDDALTKVLEQIAGLE